MVCKLDPVKMAAMVRFLSSGRHSEITAEEAAQDKVVLQTINREFHEANEANLLEEKDMHIFDSRPLTDPLYLVRCNVCEKPIKASQYAVHAERCWASNCLQEIGIEPDAGGGNKKPIKKGKKKLQNGHSNQSLANGEVENSDFADGDDVARSEFNLDEQYGTFSRTREGKSTFASANHTIKMENCDVNHGNTFHKAGAPAPLATKMYYSQGSHRFRVAISRLYYQSIAENVCSDPVPLLVQDNVVVSSGVAPDKLLHSMQKDSAAQ